ncbi:hypothetical protein [Luteolibacter sp. Populi]|uniref:hypothetical protein n=1 Tax=Luteolibacter sp. Populi TaxID=3230487 RepID=UPI003466EFF7
MSAKSGIFLILLLLLGAAGFFLFAPQELPESGAVSGPAGKAGPAKELRSGERPETARRESARAARSAEEGREATRTLRSSVTVELSPDMKAFGEGAALDEATAAALEAGRLQGAELHAALGALGRSGGEGMAKAWEIVRDEHDPAAKLAVMRSAAAKGGPGLAAILKDGLAAAHPQIRYEAVELVEPLQGKDEATRREVLGAAASGDAAVAAGALGQLAQDPRKEDLALMFRFLDHPDAEVAASARGTIDFYVDAEFKTTAEAQVWWQGNQAQFDDELEPVE